MRTIIAGSREGTTYSDLLSAIPLIDWDITIVVSGTCNGPDKFGEQWAIANGISIDPYPANWEEHGKSAGYKRNALMAQNADALLAIWNGHSKGTKHMIDLAKKHKLRVYVYIPKQLPKAFVPDTFNSEEW